MKLNPNNSREGRALRDPDVIRLRCQGRTALAPPRSRIAFTLIEVMIATTIFFVAMFSILALLSSGLHAASILRNNGPTAGMAVAELTLTNALEDNSDSGTFGEVYPDYTWQRNVHEVATNGLFQVDVTVYHGADYYSSMSILLFRKESVKH